jgi:HD-like signal output (HDOD) protein
MDVRQIIRQRLTDLPTLPEVVGRLMAIVRDERSTTAQLASVIERDQAICAAVLRVANSAYYGAYRKVDSIGRAVVVLGFEQVRSIALGTGVFAGLRGSPAGLDRRRFWLHAIGTATAARLVSERRGRQEESYFVCGLLHDIGKLLLGRHLAKVYGELIAQAQSERRALHELEAARFGLDHAEVGRLMLERWRLPEGITSGLRHHHAWEGNGEVPEAALVVALADNLCHEAGIGASGTPHLGLDHHLGARLGFGGADLLEMAQELAASSEKIEGFFSALE